MSSSHERTLSDEELDLEWEKANMGRTTSPRPQSTMARSFSLALNDLFKINGSLAELNAKVDQKKKAVSSQTSELEALEARIRATEERLKSLSTSTTSSPSSSSSAALAAQTRLSGRSSPRPTRAAIGGDTFEAQKSSLAQSEFRPSSANRPKSRREDTVQTRGLPPTPGQSEGETSSSEEESEEGGDIQRDVRRERTAV